MVAIMVITHGELLIDFVPTVTGVDLIDAPAFVKAPGGAPANVAVGLAKLGVDAAFMGQVGDDPFGRFLARTLQDAGVDVSMLSFSARARTALAFVSLRADGERDFMFYRHPSADMLYTPADVEAHAVALRGARIFHFGSISLISEPARSATLRAIDLAREGGALISYDPNLRLPLWPDAASARAGMRLGFERAQIVKVAEEELVFMTETADETGALGQVWHPGLQLVAITRGASGSGYVTPRFRGEVESILVQAIDTTGAGDAFMAGLLRGLLIGSAGLESEDGLRRLCRFANLAGALTTLQRGAIPALPSLEAVQRRLANFA